MWTLRRPDNTETTAAGVAYLAGLAVGFWKDQDEIVQQNEQLTRYSIRRWMKAYVQTFTKAGNGQSTPISAWANDR